MMMSGMWFMMLFWLLLAVAGIALIVWAVNRSRDNGSSAGRHNGDSALATLRDRFARGDISEAEYHERWRTLEGDRPAPR
jgi:putative membrane protein